MLSFFRDRKETPRLDMLRQLFLFATLSRLELRVVNGMLHERRYLKGEIIFDEGEEGQTVYMVIAGRVLICRQGEPETGRIVEIEAGVVFGELALLDDAPRAAQARALEELSLESPYAAIALNWKCIPKSEWDTTKLQEGDRVEILVPQAGG